MVSSLMPGSAGDDLRGDLEEDAAARSGCSIAEEIRRRLLRRFQQDLIDKLVRNFITEAAMLAKLTRAQTGQDWHTHPATNAVLRHAINARLARTKLDGPEMFAPVELPSRRLDCNTLK
jgi:hypothetical protein